MLDEPPSPKSEEKTNAVLDVLWNQRVIRSFYEQWVIRGEMTLWEKISGRPKYRDWATSEARRRFQDEFYITASRILDVLDRVQEGATASAVFVPTYRVRERDDRTYVVEIATGREGGPKLAGPFPTRLDAARWIKTEMPAFLTSHGVGDREPHELRQT
jgi:hypothetical protein